MKKALKIFLISFISLAFLTIPFTIPVQSVIHAQNNPYISLSTYSSYPNSSITVQGWTFSPNEPLQIKLGNNTPHQYNVVYTNADSNGNFSGVSIQVPDLAPGNVFLTVLDNNTYQVLVTQNFYIAGYYPNVTPSSWYLLPGQNIGFSGTGFAPNEKVNIYQNGNGIANVTTDGNGNFNTTNVDTIAYSQKNSTQSFMFRGSTSFYASVTDVIGVGTYYPQINPSSYYIAKGQNFSVSGTGFAPNEEVDLYINGNNLYQTNAGGSGNISFGSVTSPTSGNNFTVNAQGESSTEGSTRTITLAQ